MPQGGLEEGETPREGVYRELEEEVGTGRATIVAEHPEWLRYDLPEESRPRAWDGRYTGQEQKWFLLRFDGTDADIDIATAEPEFTDWRWATAREIQDGAVFFKRELYASVFEAFRRYL